MARQHIPHPVNRLPDGPVKMDEAQRLDVLEAYGADALEDDPELREICGFAARLCGAPVALVTLVESERQRFIGREGFAMRETPREHSFCAHTMVRPGIMEVRDAARDPLFSDNPLVTGEPYIRFYAGQPLVSDEGAPLGALCVLGFEPRERGLDALQREGLAVLGQSVMRRLQARRASLRAQYDLAHHEEQMRALADVMPAFAWSTDGEGGFDYFNKVLLDYVGETDMIDAWSVLHPDDLDHSVAAWERSLATGEPFEVEHRMRHFDGTYRWQLSRAIPVRNSAGTVVRWFGTAVDIDEVHKVSEARDLLSKELAHRIKNIFAVVIGLVSLEARNHPDHREFADSLIDTLRALGRAHEFVRPATGEANGNLAGLLEVLFAPYGSRRVAVTGPNHAISARSATPLALVFHELATNSAKYGALSSRDGRITLDIAEESGMLRLLWRESGGPPPHEAPADIGGEGTGFGSRLVEMSVTGQLGGAWERRFGPDGLVVELTVSKEAISP